MAEFRPSVDWPGSTSDGFASSERDGGSGGVKSSGLNDRTYSPPSSVKRSSVIAAPVSFSGSVFSVACGGHANRASSASLPSHLSPLDLVVPSFNVIVPSATSTPIWSRNTPIVALSPVPPAPNGCTWINPSLWVWMPRRSGPSSAGGSRNSPHTLTANASCQ